MTEDQLVEHLVSLFRGLRYSQRTWAEDARDIIALVRENTPDRSGTAREAPSTSLGTLSSVGAQPAGHLTSTPNT